MPNDPTPLRFDPAPAMGADAALAEFVAADAFREGHFLLSSGRHSRVYLQCARVMMDPVRAARLCGALAREVEALGIGPIDYCVSPAMGGVLVGFETARHLGVPSMFMERPDGVNFELRRGFEIPPGARCLMVEDVVTTGLSSRECIAAIAAVGGRTVGAAALVDRTAGKVDLGTPFAALLRIDAETYAPDALPDDLAQSTPVKPGSRKQSAQGLGR